MELVFFIPNQSIMHVDKQSTYIGCVFLTMNNQTNIKLLNNTT